MFISRLLFSPSTLCSEHWLQFFLDIMLSRFYFIRQESRTSSKKLFHVGDLSGDFNMGWSRTCVCVCIVLIKRFVRILFVIGQWFAVMSIGRCETVPVCYMAARHMHIHNGSPKCHSCSHWNIGNATPVSSIRCPWHRWKKRSQQNKKRLKNIKKTWQKYKKSL